MTSKSADSAPTNVLRVLTLDGGGAKGFYTLGVLKEIEAMIGCPLYEKFDLVYGTSTGAIIASLVALGHGVESILQLYRQHVPSVMCEKSPSSRTRALKKLAQAVFGEIKFEQVKTGVGIVATRWMTEKPMIFKANVVQAHGQKASFVPGFGVNMADAIQASCSAYPFFERTTVKASTEGEVELVDGGYCANNPCLYALADAVNALKYAHGDIRLVSIGVGIYPEPKPGLKMWFARKFLISVQLLQKTLEINTQSMDQLRQVLFKDVPTVRISDSYVKPEMATDLLEYNLGKLDLLFQRGKESFSSREEQLRKFLLQE